MCLSLQLVKLFQKIPEYFLFQVRDDALNYKQVVKDDHAFVRFKLVLHSLDGVEDPVTEDLSFVHAIKYKKFIFMSSRHKPF